VSETSEAAAHFALSRPGWSLAAATDVALPYWRVWTRLRVLSHKPLGAIDEYVLRTVDAGVDDPADIALFLGLEDVLTRAAVVGLLERDALGMRAGSRVALTGLGTELMRESALITPEVRTVEVEWDGLLRRPVAPLALWLEPRDLRRAGVREIPPSPVTPPSTEEMRSGIRKIEVLLRQVADRRAGTVDLLDVGGIDRRKRLFRPATALVFEREGGTEIQVGLVVDGRISADHEEAFARAGLARKLGVDPQRGLRSSRRYIARTLKEAETEDDGRPLAPHEHADALELALRRAVQRIVIVGRELRRAVVDDDFVEHLEARLAQDVQVTLGWSARARESDVVDPLVLRDLKQLAARHPGLSLTTSSSDGGALIMDDRVAVLTSYDYLGNRGGAARDLHDERGLLYTASHQVDAIASAVSARLTPFQERPPRRRRPNGADAGGDAGDKSGS
jgi:hypothetical protein